MLYFLDVTFERGCAGVSDTDDSVQVVELNKHNVDVEIGKAN